MTLETGLKWCHNYIVVIDTNRFKDYSNNTLIPFCTCNKCHSFLSERKNRNGIPLGKYYITENVFGEIIKQQSKEFAKAKKDLKNISKKLNTIN